MRKSFFVKIMVLIMVSFILSAQALCGFWVRKRDQTVCVHNETLQYSFTDILCDGPWEWMYFTTGTNCGVWTWSLNIQTIAQGVTLEINNESGELAITVDQTYDGSDLLFYGRIQGLSNMIGGSGSLITTGQWFSIFANKTSYRCECLQYFAEETCATATPASCDWPTWHCNKFANAGSTFTPNDTSVDCPCVISQPSTIDQSLLQDFEVNGQPAVYTIANDQFTINTAQSPWCTLHSYEFHISTAITLDPYTYQTQLEYSLVWNDNESKLQVIASQEGHFLTLGIDYLYIKVFASNGQFIFAEFPDGNQQFRFVRYGCIIQSSFAILTAEYYIDGNSPQFVYSGSYVLTTDPNCTINSIEFYDSTYNSVPDWSGSSTSSQVTFVSNVVEHRDGSIANQSLSFYLLFHATNGMYQWWNQTLIIAELKRCDYIIQPSLTTSPIQFEIDGYSIPNYLITSGSFSTSLPSSCLLTGFEFYDSIHDDRVLDYWSLTGFSGPISVIHNKVNYEEELPVTHNIYIKLYVNNVFTFWAQDQSSGVDKFQFTVTACYDYIIYPWTITSSTKKIISDQKSIPYWLMGEFVTNTGCQIDSISVFDDDSTSANQLNEWRVEFKNQVLKIWLPEGSQQIQQTIQFYLRFNISGVQTFSNAYNVRNSGNKFFTFEVIVPSEGPPYFVQNLTTPMIIFIDDGKVSANYMRFELPKIIDPDAGELVFVFLSHNISSNQLQFKYNYAQNSIEVVYDGTDLSYLINENYSFSMNITLMNMKAQTNLYQQEIKISYLKQESINQINDQGLIGKLNTQRNNNSLYKLVEFYKEKGNTPRPLKAYIDNYDQNGLIVIKFNQKMKTEGIHIPSINNKTLNISFVKQLNFQGNYSQFTWNTTSFEDRILKIKVTFQQPLIVSPDLNYQNMKIEFIPQYLHLFTSEFGNLTLHQDYWILMTRVPRQSPQDQVNQNFQFYADSLGSVTFGLFIFSIILYTVVTIDETVRSLSFKSGSNALRHMTMFVRALQLVIHLPCMRNPFPANVMYIYQALLPVVGFDFLDILFDWREQNAIDLNFKRQQQVETRILDQVKDIGYETHISLISLNSLSIFVSFQFFGLTFIIFIWISSKFFTISEGNILNRISNTLQKALLFRGLTQLIFDAYFEFMISGCLNLAFYHSSPFGELFSSIIAFYAVLMTVIILPLISIVLIVPQTSTLNNEQTKSLFGNLYEELKYRYRISRSYLLIFIVRRLIFLALCFYFLATKHSFITQILITNYVNLICIFYMGLSTPFNFKFDNKFALFHEFMITQITQTTLLFTIQTSGSTYQDKYNLSWIAVILIGFWCVIDLGMVVKFAVQTFQVLLVKYYRICCRAYINKFAKQNMITQQKTKDIDWKESSQNDTSESVPNIQENEAAHVKTNQQNQAQLQKRHQILQQIQSKEQFDSKQSKQSKQQIIAQKLNSNYIQSLQKYKIHAYQKLKRDWKSLQHRKIQMQNKNNQIKRQNLNVGHQIKSSKLIEYKLSKIVNQNDNQKKTSSKKQSMKNSEPAAGIKNMPKIQEEKDESISSIDLNSVMNVK